MAAIVSALSVTTRDQAGNPRTEVWYTLEFGEAYQAAGIAFDLSNQLRRIEHAVTDLISGGQLRAPISGELLISNQSFGSGSWPKVIPVMTDYTTPVSTRFQLLGIPGLVTSGLFAASAPAVGLTPIGSALAASVSGVRFIARVLGY